MAATATLASQSRRRESLDHADRRDRPPAMSTLHERQCVQRQSLPQHLAWCVRSALCRKREPVERPFDVVWSSCERRSLREHPASDSGIQLMQPSGQITDDGPMPLGVAQGRIRCDPGVNLERYPRFESWSVSVAVHGRHLRVDSPLATLLFLRSPKTIPDFVSAICELSRNVGCARALRLTVSEMLVRWPRDGR